MVGKIKLYTAFIYFTEEGCDFQHYAFLYYAYFSVYYNVSAHQVEVRIIEEHWIIRKTSC